MIPKHGFIWWLALLDRLSTRSRKHKFSPRISPTCVFYDADETRDHLFFSCSYSSLIRSKVGSILGIPSLTIWDTLLRWGSSLKRKPSRAKFASWVSKLAFITFGLKGKRGSILMLQLILKGFSSWFFRTLSGKYLA